MEIGFKKCGISNQPDVCIFDDPCLSKVWSTPRVMSASRKTICRTFVCVPYGTSEQKHNRAKPLFESASALFLIADA